MEIKVYGDWEKDFPNDYFTTTNCKNSDEACHKILDYIENSILNDNYNIKLLCPENFLTFDMQTELISSIEKTFPQIILLEIITFSPAIIMNGYLDKVVY